MDEKVIILNASDEVLNLEIGITRNYFHELRTSPVNYISLGICSNKAFAVYYETYCYHVKMYFNLSDK